MLAAGLVVAVSKFVLYERAHEEGQVALDAPVGMARQAQVLNVDECLRELRLNPDALECVCGERINI